jgi:hypothetical protein
MQLWEILFAGCLNMVSALDKKLQQNNSSSSSASGSQTDGALPSHDGPLVSFNIIVGTVNIASSFTRFFGAARLCRLVSSLALGTLPAVPRIKLCSCCADFV